MSLETTSPQRPQTTAILAVSLDGKLASASAQGDRIASAYDFQHLEEHVAQADAVLFGATTLRLGGTAMRLQSPSLIQQRLRAGKPPQPLQIVCSASGDLDLALPFFQQPIPRALVTTETGRARWQGSSAFEYCWCADRPHWDWSWVLGQIATVGIQRLAVLGGGHLFASLLQVQAIDELWLTVCPLMLGSSAPSLMPLKECISPTMTLVSAVPVGDEVYLHYRLRYGEDKGTMIET
ncbi:RibD family protein [Parathermosynechococcus lividus]